MSSVRRNLCRISAVMPRFGLLIKKKIKKKMKGGSWLGCITSNLTSQGDVPKHAMVDFSFILSIEGRGRPRSWFLLFWSQFSLFSIFFVQFTLTKQLHDFGIIIHLRGDSSYEQLEILNLRIACSTLFLRQMRPLLECGDH